MSETLKVFYQVERAGCFRLSDGGGPLGFDVTLALLLDDVQDLYKCDVLVETGCFVGDTTAYLARRYPHLPVFSCDVDYGHAAVTRQRVAAESNAVVSHADSPTLVADVAACYERPLFFLDAHWDEEWPLVRELDAITAGIAVIHDFDIGHPRFAFDHYNEVVCGPEVLAAMAQPPARYFTPDPHADHPLPCLQVGRRAGAGIVAIGVDTRPLEQHPHLITRTPPVRAAATR
ncbi:hypothetical protein [Actinomadura sp. HBU206391]|uniref:hypothetical protein n=1 Tax=Actinomadura sp. HBU206391 TaxID=2731692 RepID=UPI0016503967|nr:hypothetical protein [Actinomadura sp. HBU206391]MBC6457092.1 hypothetical protein [Actinomadura sp. HBU206391]